MARPQRLGAPPRPPASAHLRNIHKGPSERISVPLSSTASAHLCCARASALRPSARGWPVTWHAIFHSPCATAASSHSSSDRGVRFSIPHLSTNKYLPPSMTHTPGVCARRPLAALWIEPRLPEPPVTKSSAQAWVLGMARPQPAVPRGPSRTRRATYPPHARHTSWRALVRLAASARPVASDGPSRPSPRLADTVPTEADR